jgi:hypothetical protein
MYIHVCHFQPLLHLHYEQEGRFAATLLEVGALRLTCVSALYLCTGGGQTLYYNPQPLCPAIEWLLRPLFRHIQYQRPIIAKVVLTRLQ